MLTHRHIMLNELNSDKRVPPKMNAYESIYTRKRVCTHYYHIYVKDLELQSFIRLQD